MGSIYCCRPLSLQVSAKMGLGIEEVLEAVVARIPAPTNRTAAPLRALIFDSYYDAYRGVVCQFRVQVSREVVLHAGVPRWKAVLSPHLMLLSSLQVLSRMFAARIGCQKQGGLIFQELGLQVPVSYC